MSATVQQYKKESAQELGHAAYRYACSALENQGWEPSGEHTWRKGHETIYVYEFDVFRQAFGAINRFIEFKTVKPQDEMGG